MRFQQRHGDEAVRRGNGCRPMVSEGDSIVVAMAYELCKDAVYEMTGEGVEVR